ncbi:MAG: hypothetical protein KOO62_09040 [candidate division Zixibacteria bacterium]|nr:hypothetical protein [candidate division Zixibacteria bacterium]
MRNILVLLGIAVFITCLYYVSSAQEPTQTLRSSMGEERYLKCGLGKLSAEEEHELLRVFSIGPMPSYTTEAAAHYMKRQGWREVRVIGAVQTSDPSDEYWVVVWDRYELHALDPWSMPYLPDPGVYWAKNSLGSWTILYPDATEVSFTARDLN